MMQLAPFLLGCLSDKYQVTFVPDIGGFRIRLSDRSVNHEESGRLDIETLDAMAQSDRDWSGVDAEIYITLQGLYDRLASRANKAPRSP